MSSPPFFLRDSRASETQAHVKIILREKSPFLAWVIFTRARVSLALLSLRKNGGLLADCTSSLALGTRTMKNLE